MRPTGFRDVYWCTAPKRIAGAEMRRILGGLGAFHASRLVPLHRFSKVSPERVGRSHCRGGARPGGVEPALARRFFVTEVSTRRCGSVRAQADTSRLCLAKTDPTHFLFQLRLWHLYGTFNVQLELPITSCLRTKVVERAMRRLPSAAQRATCRARRQIQLDRELVPRTAESARSGALGRGFRFAEAAVPT